MAYLATFLISLLCAVIAWADKEIVDTSPEQALPVLEVEVIAMQYPPYTGSQLTDYGLAFRALQAKLDQTDGARVVLTPHFLPPARAGLAVQEGHWQASFFPPVSGLKESYRNVLPSHEPIKIGLFRLHKMQPFLWDYYHELEGRVAFTRLKGNSPIRDQMVAAGLNIVEVDSLEQSFRLLRLGRVDYVFSERLAGFYIGLNQGMTHDDLQFSDKNVLIQLSMNVWLNTDTPEGLELFRRLSPE
ncbi:hypothetical protein [Oceanospirillum beijerinckii]|uniref:hypothetical protein n=1 Tax=Oceanospirillum beijerinckii TaxID=64976 RepID=UPI00041269D2|nr:hypothetical protein [Oceanospirillum beijerinckii]